MLKKAGIRLLALAAMVFILFIAQAQTQEQGWKKTITLPSGEVVCDLNGEWDSLWQGRGEYQTVGRLRVAVKITQQGNSFEGIRMHETPRFAKGSVILTGELDKYGFKKVLFQGGEVSDSLKGKISKDGNKIEFEPNSNYYFDLTRK